jgi:hypothetical protein
MCPLRDSVVETGNVGVVVHGLPGDLSERALGNTACIFPTPAQPTRPPAPRQARLQPRR